MTQALLLAISLLASDPASPAPQPEASAIVAPPAEGPPEAKDAPIAPAPAAPAAPEVAPTGASSGAASPAVAEPGPAAPDAASAAAAPPPAPSESPTPSGPPTPAEPAAASPSAVGAPADTADTAQAAAAVAPAPESPSPTAPPADPVPAAEDAGAAGTVAAPVAIGSEAPPTPPAPECACAKPKRPTRWGLTLDGGFPDAAGVGVLYRPWSWLRLEAGGTTTVYASHGYRVGVSLVPFHFPITPALTLNYGRALEADWNPMLARLGASDPDLEPVLRKFGYQYVDAHLGLEIGAPRRFVFFVRAGLTQLWTTVHGLTDAARSAIDDASRSVTISDTRIAMRVPSFKLGFLVYFF